MTSSSNRNRPRRRLAGERRLAGARRPPHASGSGPAVDQGLIGTAEGHPSANNDGPRRMIAGLVLLLSAAVMVTSLVLWRAAENRQALAASEAAASSAARTTIEKLLGYDYRTFDRHTGEVSALLTGSFRNEFVQAATTVVKPLAIQNKAVVVAKASEVSVMSSPRPGDVRLLLFVDQDTTSAKLQRPQIDQNRVILTMSQVRGRWLVSKIDAF